MEICWGGAEVSVKIQARDVDLGVARVLGAVDLHEVTQDPIYGERTAKGKRRSLRIWGI